MALAALKINQKTEGTTLTLELEGQLSVGEARDFDSLFAEAARGMREALLDFSKVSYISSAGLRSLFLAKKKMTEQGGELKVLCPSPEAMEVFEATHYDSIVTILRSREEDTAPTFYPLRPMQKWLVDSHLQKAQSTMMNIAILARLDDSLDMERFAAVLNEVLSDYDIFRCRFAIHPETGEVCQRFDGTVERISVESLSNEAFEKLKRDLKEPYDLIGAPLYHIHLMKTATAQYLYTDFYNALMDGVSAIVLFAREVDKRYLGKRSSRKAPSYAEYVLAEARIPAEQLAEGHAYWKKMTAGFDEKKHLPPRDVEGVGAWAKSEVEFPLETEIPGNFFRGKGFSENTFFLAAAMLALAKAAGVRESVMSWVHSGRNTMQESRLMGMMLHQLPIRCEFTEGLTALDLLHRLEERTNESLAYCKSLDMVYDEGIEDLFATFLLQKGAIGRRGTITLGGKEAIIEEMPENDRSAAENTLDMELNARDDGGYSLVLSFDASRFSEGSMRRLAADYGKMVSALLDEGCLVTDLLK